MQLISLDLIFQGSINPILVYSETNLVISIQVYIPKTGTLSNLVSTLCSPSKVLLNGVLSNKNNGDSCYEIGHFREFPRASASKRGQVRSLQDLKMIFHSHANKTHFCRKARALGLILKVRVFGTRKWSITHNDSQWLVILGRA